MTGSLPGKIEAITFDAGGTLIEPWPSVGAVYAAVAREHGIDCCPDRLTRQFVEGWKSRVSFNYSREEWHELVRHSFHGMASVHDDLFRAIYDRFNRHDAWLIYEDVIPVLQRAEALGLTLGVISNWDERLGPLLETLGLATYFKSIVLSVDAGETKPGARIFRTAADALGVSRNRILHIGDSQREDVEGARAAGFHAFRIRRSGPEKEDDLSTLIEALDRIEI